MGFFCGRNAAQLHDWQKTKNQKQDGRVFYKVDYKPERLGLACAWCQCDRRALKQACKGLRALLKSCDGKDHALKPACDHGCCDSGGVDLPGSNLSNMGECGRPRAARGRATRTA